MSIYEYSLAEIWNSDAMRNIRRLMVDGKPVDGCASCYEQIKRKHRSVGEAANDAYEAGYLNPRKETLGDLKHRAASSDFAFPNGPGRLNINFGNLCNLKCRMCNSARSSAIAADPVQSRWPHLFASSPPPARWNGHESLIAPHKRLGITYEGLSEIDWSNAEPVAWTNGHAEMIMNADGIDMVGMAVTIAGDRPAGQRLRLLVNSHVIYDDVPEPGPWSRTFNTEHLPLNDPKLHISIESFVGVRNDHAAETGVGIQRLALVRATKSRNSISIGRFASGRQWFQDKEFIESDLFYDLPSIRTIHLVGGEPLLIKEVHDVMRYLISTGRSKDIALSVVTNGTVMDEEWSELAVQFKSLTIALSLDGYAELNSYIRYPSEWDTIVSNITRLQDIPKAYVYVNMTVQTYNMLRITELVDFCERVGLDIVLYPAFDPGQLDCNGMPDKIRATAAERLRRYATRNQPDPDRPNRLIDYRKGILAFAESLETPSTRDTASAVREFMIFTNDLAQSRQQKFSDVGSELITMLEEQGYPWINETRFAKFADADSGSKVAHVQSADNPLV